ncbi:MAG: hypothetical protein WC220_08465 [Pedobacter sp.]|jgi:hypothetical protein
MDAIFTVCTYNHLGRALSLSDSVKNHCPDAKFIICLIDSIEDYKLPEGIRVISAQAMRLPFLNEMCSKYSLLELNSALKPYFANYILGENKDVEQIIFLDSDILLFSDLQPVYEALKSGSIVISPHSLSPVPDKPDFDDRIFLRSGIYNAGFFALKKDQHSQAFLNWWMDKLRNQCFFDSKRGMFAEQLWMNLIPLYFENVHVLRHMGCNVAYWNMHERALSEKNDSWYVNENIPLIFFHYSGAAITCLEENSVSNHQSRYNFDNRPDVLPLFKLYIESLKRHSFEKYNEFYSVNSNIRTRWGLIISVAELYKKVIKKVFYNR